MESTLKTIILRFRDLNTSDTIKVHKDIIDSSKYVWWGWWAKPQEKVPIDEFNFLNTLISNAGQIKIYLLDSGNEKLYDALCTQIMFCNGQPLETPDSDITPEYYRENQYKLWFKFSQISNCYSESEALELLHKYSYLCVDNFFVSGKSPFSVFYNKQVYSLSELSEQQRTIWFLREWKKGDKTHEIHSYNNEFLRDDNYLSSYKVLKSNEILWLSDLHFSDKYHCFSQKPGDSNKLSIRLNTELERHGIERPSFMIISGDLTYTASQFEFEKALSFMQDINSIYGLNSSLYAIVPGNHDISFSDEEFDEKKPVTVAYDKAKESYVNFYRKYFGVEPRETLFSVHRFLTNNLQPFEIICLNSCLLQQEKGHFQGMGFVGNDQLVEVEKCMKETQDSKSFRILVMHHHLLPVLFKEEPKADRMYSMMLDSEAISQFIVRNGIRLVLHGHTHKEFYSEIIRKVDDDKKFKYYVVGVGSVGVVGEELSESRPNMFAVLNVKNDKVTINEYAIYSDGQNGKLLYSHDIPLEEEIR